MLLYFRVFLRGPVDQITVLRKSGSVAWAVPAVLLLVSAQRTAEMRAAFNRRDHEIGNGRYSFSAAFIRPSIISAVNLADIIEVVIPHPLNPEATNVSRILLP